MSAILTREEFEASFARSHDAERRADRRFHADRLIAHDAAQRAEIERLGVEVGAQRPKTAPVAVKRTDGMSFTPEKIAEQLALCEKATPGPWRWSMVLSTYTLDQF